MQGQVPKKVQRLGAKRGGLKVDPRMYPKTPCRGETYFEPRPGKKVLDVFHELEDPEADICKEFVREQNKLTEQVLEECPGRADYTELMTTLMDYPKTTAPRKKGDLVFYYHNTGLQAQSVLYSQSGAVDPKRMDETSQVVIDPNQLSDDGTVSLSSASFTKDGKLLAYALSSGGSDWKEVRVLGIEDGGKPVEMEDKLMWVKFSSLAWTHDNKGFFYNSYPEPSVSLDKAGTETGSNENQRLMYHRVGSNQKDDALIWEAKGEESQYMMGAEISDDGRWAVLTICKGCDAVNQLHLLPLAEDLALPQGSTFADAIAVIDDFEAEYEYVSNDGSAFVFKTNHKAPRSKVLRVDVADKTNFGTPEAWETLIPEDPADVLEWVSAMKGGNLVTCYLHNARHILQHRSSGTGELKRSLDELPVGSVAGFTGNADDDEAFVKFTSFTSPGSIFRLDVSGSSCKVEVFKETELNCPAYKPEDLVTEQVFVKSKDGTRVPMFVVGTKGAVGELRGESPKGAALLYGYGGFNISLTPSFSASRLSYILGFGGVVAIANLRGGGEFGEEWHKAGVGLQKQNVFDDFQSCGEFLIREGYCAEDKLAIEGGSNGGLLVGACLNQRPDLFACGIAHVGVMDMLKFQRFTIGHAWCTDFGNSEDSDEMFEYIVKYSPLHNVPSGSEVTYPATMVLTGDHDDRVVPLHSLKFIAELQYQQILSILENGEEPVQTNPLVARIETRAGHGAGKPTKKVIQQNADVYSFVAAATSTPWVLADK
ncbi:prolyl oligopeptidase [Chloropicon primus]|uniref:Prolyl endopeptidase n=2 Tax=Chloropicon primus TaxID=1764295 RepID=A0A5B8MPU7_9CHLO|nr:prolyl oligopeptidase [Chloropicon primus]UPR01727.1 prolyl oligopeptidase [Chloropicon primus]|eukprot:QDZ22506.1 prolyl oligopeptidase [Chloropicon primus]